MTPPEPAGTPFRGDLGQWRKAERDRLISDRLAVPAETRRTHGEAIAAALERAFGAVDGLTVAAYWPIRGEPDLRPLLDRLTARGANCALPVVVERARPVEFRAWKSGERLERGIWNIPVPAEGQVVVPDIVVSPVVGFDPQCYRLGYGGGYYDRTLAALPRKPRIFGVGYARAALATIYPQPHDIPMDTIVTETGVLAPVRR